MIRMPQNLWPLLFLFFFASCQDSCRKGANVGPNTDNNGNYCEGGRIRGASGNCECPPGTRDAGVVCLAIDSLRYFTLGNRCNCMNDFYARYYPSDSSTGTIFLRRNTDTGGGGTTASHHFENGRMIVEAIIPKSASKTDLPCDLSNVLYRGITLVYTVNRDSIYGTFKDYDRNNTEIATYPFVMTR